MSDTDKTRGLYPKYRVTRIADPDGKHAACEYYLLDLVHDPFSRPALLAYADACEGSFPTLAEDLRRKAASVPPAEDTPIAKDPTRTELLGERDEARELAHRERERANANARELAAVYGRRSDDRDLAVKLSGETLRLDAERTKLGLRVDDLHAALRDAAAALEAVTGFVVGATTHDREDALARARAALTIIRRVLGEE